MIKRVGALGLVCGLLASLTIVAAPVSVGLAAESDACNGSHSENNVTVTPTHGQNFYVDLKASQDADASYLGYKIAASSAVTDLWVQVGSFAGGSVSLADTNDDLRPIGDLASGASATAFFFVKAAEVTESDQTHLVEVFNGKPSLDGSTLVASCTFTFLEVADTIKASANKVSSVAVNAGTDIGSTYVITVNGETGTIGNGSSPDGSVIWLSPAARSSWPTEALRLESTLIQLFDTGQGQADCESNVRESYTDVLLIDADGMSASCYTATYTFRIVGQADQSVTAVPIAQISSGTQYKHTDLAAGFTGDATIDLSQPTLDMTTDINASTTVSTDATATTIDYTVTLTNNGPAVTVDEIVVTVPDTHTFETGAQFDGGVTPDPANVTGTNDWVFPGPFDLPDGSSSPTTKQLAYTTSIPCGSSSATGYAGNEFSEEQTAVARVGDIQIGASVSTEAGVRVAGNCGAAGPSTSVVEQFSRIDVDTAAATDLTATTAVLNGEVKPRGRRRAPVRFVYSTASDMSNPTTVCATSVNGASGSFASGDEPLPTTYDLGGLQPGTTYYFKVRFGGPRSACASVSSASMRAAVKRGLFAPAVAAEIDGDVESFVTPTSSAPTASTGSASSIDADAQTATLGGSVNPNGTATRAEFEWGKKTSASCSSLVSAQIDSALVWTDADDDGSYDAGEEDTLSDAASVDVSLDVADIEVSSDYCFRIVALHGSNYDTRVVGDWAEFTVGAPSADDPPAEETPAEETPAEETPAEEAPAEETPAEETPAEESSTTTSAPAATAGGGGPSGRPSGQQQIVEKLTLSSKKEQEPNTGTLEIGSSPSGPGVELQSATTSTSGYEIEIVSTGTDYNKPETWVAEGFGEICWKIEDFTDADYVFVLDDVPSPPNGVDGVDYEWSAVKVKAGSIRSTDPDFQVNTMFMAPEGGTAVFADSNKSGTSDPGGGSGDKSISHIIFCVNPVSTGSGTTTSAPTTAPPTTAAPTTAAPTTAAPTTAAPTTAAPTTAAPTTAAPTTAAPTTAAPTTAAPTTATPTTVPLPKPPVVIRLKPVVAPTTTAPDTTAAPTTAAPTTATPTTAAPTTAAPTTAAPTTAAPTTTVTGGSTTPTTSTAPADGSSTTASPATTAAPTTDAPSEVAEIRMILSTGNETVEITVKVRPASFEVLDSPVPQVSLPATGSSSPVWPGVLLLGLGVAVIGVRRRVF